MSSTIQESTPSNVITGNQITPLPIGPGGNNSTKTQFNDLNSKMTMMIAQVCDLKVGEFIHTFGDAHIYNNHFEQLELQLSRETRSLPKMIINPEIKDIFDFKFEDFILEGYDPHPGIRGEVAV